MSVSPFWFAKLQSREHELSSEKHWEQQFQAEVLLCLRSGQGIHVAACASGLRLGFPDSSMGDVGGKGTVSTKNHGDFFF